MEEGKTTAIAATALTASENNGHNGNSRNKTEIKAMKDLRTHCSRRRGNSRHCFSVIAGCSRVPEHGRWRRHAQGGEAPPERRNKLKA